MSQDAHDRDDEIDLTDEELLKYIIIPALNKQLKTAKLQLDKIKRESNQPGYAIYDFARSRKQETE